MIISEELIVKTKEWLGEDGLRFFKETKEKHGEIAVTYMEGNIPHPVHFREGMSVRNFMRDTELCKDCTAHDYDNNWVALIEKCIE